MNLYVMDCGWAGCIIVWASSEEEARNIMRDCVNYHENLPVERKELVPGIVFQNCGDM